MSGIITAFERGLWRGVVIVGTSVAVTWVVERLWGRP